MYLLLVDSVECVRDFGLSTDRSCKKSQTNKMSSLTCKRVVFLVLVNSHCWFRPTVNVYS